MNTSSVWTYIVSMKRVAAAKFKEQCRSIIAATSVVHHVPLLTRNRRIRASRVVPLA